MEVEGVRERVRKEGVRVRVGMEGKGTRERRRG